MIGPQPIPNGRTTRAAARVRFGLVCASNHGRSFSVAVVVRWPGGGSNGNGEDQALPNGGGALSQSFAMTARWIALGVLLGCELLVLSMLFDFPESATAPPRAPGLLDCASRADRGIRYSLRRGDTAPGVASAPASMGPGRSRTSAPGRAVPGLDAPGTLSWHWARSPACPDVCPRILN